MMSPAEFAEKLKAAAAEMRVGIAVPTKESMELAAEKARDSLGSDPYGWPPHTEGTVERWGEHPIGVLSGETKGSVGSEAIIADGGAEGAVYATTQQAVFFEMGTINQQPRSFLYQSLLHSMPEFGKIYGAFAEKILGGIEE